MYKISAQSDLFLKSYRVNGRTHRPILECTHFLSTQKEAKMVNCLFVFLNSLSANIRRSDSVGYS